MCMYNCTAKTGSIVFACVNEAGEFAQVQTAARPQVARQADVGQRGIVRRKGPYGELRESVA